MAFRTVFSSKLTDGDRRNIFVKARSGKSVSCSRCLGKKILWVSDRRFRCKTCWSFGSLTKHTWFERSKLSLRFWYALLWNFALCHSARNGKQEYVDGEVHINGLEGFWGLSKTNMHTYKGIRKKNWLLYLKEMEFRYNNRTLSFDEMVEKIMKVLMSYKRKGFVPY